jgi:hypothetical protein
VRTIWRFDLDVGDDTVVIAPEGAEFLPHVEAPDPSTVSVWAIVDSDAPLVDRVMHVRGTGHPLREVGRYLGTALVGPLVWHVFEAAS